MNTNLISIDEKRMILKAVMEAERYTSVEFLVHIDNACKNDEVEKASGIFKILHMNKTKTKIWVLFYLSLEDHKFAIIGDDDIVKILPAHFWNEIKVHMRAKLSEGNLAASLSEGIKMSGEKLKLFVPKQKDDINELPDEIIIGKGVNEYVS